LGSDMGKHALLEVSPLFSIYEREALAASAVRKAFSAEQVIFSKGDRTGRIFVVESGRVRLSQIARGGQELFLRSVGRGYVLGQMSALDGKPHSVSATAQGQIHDPLSIG